ncbi:MAG: hypothetical protein HY738_05545 [Bacteroidia bacterium]|nr:hypothetical protein [Bacteroidia bacterium]
MEKSPFIFGKIVSRDNFCDREEDIRQLTNYITDGISVWLYSPRRYGKSSLIHRVFEEIKSIKTILYLKSGYA